MAKQNKTIIEVFVDKEGNIKGHTDFENSLKWDSPAIVRATQKMINKGNKK